MKWLHLGESSSFHFCVCYHQTKLNNKTCWTTPSLQPPSPLSPSSSFFIPSLSIQPNSCFFYCFIYYLNVWMNKRNRRVKGLSLNQNTWFLLKVLVLFMGIALASLVGGNKSDNLVLGLGRKKRQKNLGIGSGIASHALTSGSFLPRKEYHNPQPFRVVERKKKWKRGWNWKQCTSVLVQLLWDSSLASWKLLPFLLPTLQPKYYC